MGLYTSWKRLCILRNVTRRFDRRKWTFCRCSSCSCDNLYDPSHDTWAYHDGYVVLKLKWLSTLRAENFTILKGDFLFSEAMVHFCSDPSDTTWHMERSWMSYLGVFVVRHKRRRTQLRQWGHMLACLRTLMVRNLIDLSLLPQLTYAFPPFSHGSILESRQELSVSDKTIISCLIQYNESFY